MIQNWNIDGKKGNVVFHDGEVVYQTKGVVIEAIYQTADGKRYVLSAEVKCDDRIEINGRQYIAIDGREFANISGQNVLVKSDKDKLLEVYTNPMNLYCYRQDGK